MNTLGLHPAYIGLSASCASRSNVALLGWLYGQPCQHVSFNTTNTILKRRMSAQSKPHPKGHRATIALGSNLGDRVANIESAIRLMKENDLRVMSQSFLYETKAMYHKDQARFLNGACEVFCPWFASPELTLGRSQLFRSRLLCWTLFKVLRKLLAARGLSKRGLELSILILFSMAVSRYSMIGSLFRIQDSPSETSYCGP